MYTTCEMQGKDSSGGHTVDYRIRAALQEKMLQRIRFQENPKMLLFGTREILLD